MIDRIGPKGGSFETPEIDPASSAPSTKTQSADLVRQGIQDNVFSDETSNIANLRQIIGAARAEGKLPLSENNINRVLAESQNHYTEIASNVKQWVADNFSLPGHESEAVQSLSDADLAKIQNAATDATHSGKLITVKLNKLSQEDTSLQAEAEKAKEGNKGKNLGVILTGGSRDAEKAADLQHQAQIQLEFQPSFGNKLKPGGIEE